MYPPLQILSIQLSNFKNHTSRKLQFVSEKVLIVGKNGVGKTNLLDAIYFASLTKSAFQSDKQIVTKNEKFCRIELCFQIQHEQKKVIALYAPPERKQFSVNGYHYETLAEYIGQFPVVLIAPNDTDLIREGSEERRRFFDTLLCQIDKTYLQHLSSYNKNLKQRNALLQQFKEKKKADYTLIEIYDEQMLFLAEKISNKREQIVKKMLPVVQNYYKMIASDTKEQVYMYYDSEVLKENFRKAFKENFTKDCLYERTTMGVHKDDYTFLLEENTLKKYGSQGQQKTFLIALKLAMFRVMEEVLQKKPILLLDDILDKLDEKRSQFLLDMVHSTEFGQVIITEANQKRVALINQENKWYIETIS
ncbi:MAG: DNA replication and repair protein RecF [Raineya sp.]